MAHQEALPAARLQRNAELLHAAAANDLGTCKVLLSPSDTENEVWDGSADAWYADEELGWDALHYAADHGNAPLVKLLLQCGALWNAVDNLGYTAGDVAWSRNATPCYTLLLEEGVRQSFLTELLERRANTAVDEDEAQKDDHARRSDDAQVTSLTLVPGTQDEVQASNKAFLASPLTFEKDERGQWRA